MTRGRRLRRLLVVAAALVAAACGYRFTPRGAELPGGARTLYVPVFKNLTAEPGVEAWFTDALRQELARVGREGGEGSDATGFGEVTEVSDVAAIVATDKDLPPRPLSMRVQAKATIRVVEAERTLAQISVSGAEDYLPGTGAVSVLDAEAERRIALRRLAASLMREATERLAAGF